jgi:hypothetical protein
MLCLFPFPVCVFYQQPTDEQKKSIYFCHPRSYDGLEKVFFLEKKLEALLKNDECPIFKKKESVKSIRLESISLILFPSSLTLELQITNIVCSWQVLLWLV